MSHLKYYCGKKNSTFRFSCVLQTFSPSKMTSRAQLQQVKPVNMDKLYSGEVPESLANSVILTVDNKWSLSHYSPSVSKFSLAKKKKENNLYNTITI